MQKEAMSEKIFMYILSLLIELLRDYRAAKSSFQKIKAQKEKAEENS